MTSARMRTEELDSARGGPFVKTCRFRIIRDHKIKKPGYRFGTRWPEVWDLAIKGSPEPPFNKLGVYDMTSKGTGKTFKGTSFFQQPISLGKHEGKEITLNSFPLYINENKAIWVNFPPINASQLKWSDNEPLTVHKRNVITLGGETFHVTPDVRLDEKDYKKSSHYAMLLGAYVASFVCGVSQRNLIEGSNMSRSLARFHLYYQIRSFIANPDRLDLYESELRKARTYIPYIYANTPDGLNNLMAKPYSDTDYLSMIAYDSRGIRDIGLLQESIRAYMWCILGGQALSPLERLIDGTRGESDDARKNIAKVVDWAVHRNYSPADSRQAGTLIDNTRKAVKDTNAVVNLAITPEVVKMPSNMLFRKLKLIGYESGLPVAKKGVDRFGPNAYTKPLGPSALEKAAAPPKIDTKPQPLANRASKALPTNLDPKERHIPKTMTPKRVVTPKPNVHKSVVVKPHGSDLHKRDEGVVTSEPKKEDPKVVTERKPVGRFGQYSVYIFGGSIGAWAALTHFLTR